MIDLEGESEAKNRVLEKSERIKLSKEFYLSVALAIIAVGLIIIILNLLPILERRFFETTQENYFGENFFYWWDYKSSYTGNPISPWRYYLSRLQGSYGFNLIMISAMIMLILSNGIMAKSKREFTILTYINWIIYSIAIIGFATAWYRQHAQLEEVSWIVGHYINFLTFYPICLNVPIQIHALLEGMSYREWIEINIKTIKPSTKEKIKKTYLFFVIVFYFGTWFWPIGYGYYSTTNSLYPLFGIFYAAYLATLVLYHVVRNIKNIRIKKRKAAGSI